MKPDPAAVARTRAGYSALVREGWIAQGPEAARARIVARYGAVPDATGRDCPGLTALRALVERVDRRLRPGFDPAYALTFVAPHTHWRPRPIYVRFDAAATAYRIGPVRPRLPVLPVSYAFGPDGPIPYEWADASVGLDASSVAEVTTFVTALCREALADPFLGPPPQPFGVALNYRFKTLFGPQIFPTMEIPADDGSGAARIVIDRMSDPTDRRFVGQVGWPVATAPARLSKKLLAAIREIESALAGLPYEEALAAYEALAAHARSSTVRNSRLAPESATAPSRKWR